MITMAEKIETLKNNLEFLNLKAGRYGFKNRREENIKDYLVTRDYYSYLKNNSKMMGIKDTQKHYFKSIIKIINQRFKDEIANYKYSEIDNDKLLTYIIKRMPIFKEELISELTGNLT